LLAGQSEGKPVSVFGGYAGKSWEGYAEGKWVDARDSFLFTVTNPFGDGIVTMPVNEGSTYADLAVYCCARYGPSFAWGFYVKSSSESRTAEFDNWTGCWLKSDGTFGDPLGQGRSTFTGAERFTPLEIEVWRVC
jgi:hypothetical protein